MAVYMNFLDKYDTFLFDCDGVLWHGNTAIEGAANVVTYLLQNKKTVLLVTNNGTKTRSILLKMVHALLGIGDFPSENMYSSGIATTKYIKRKIKPGEKVFLIGSPGLKEIMDESNIPVVGYGPFEPRLFSEYAATKLDEKVKYVVGSFDPYCNHAKITHAFLYIKELKAEYIASNLDKLYPLSPTRTLPGTGSILAGLNNSLNQQPLVIGKPSPIFFEIIADDFNINDKSRVLMVGDNLQTDITFAENVGIDSALVLTGIVKPEDAQNRSNLPVQPTYILPSVGNLLDSDLLCYKN